MSREEVFQDGWEFYISQIDTAFEDAEQSSRYRPVELPHDWLIGNTDWFAAELSMAGWYRNVFFISQKPEGERWVLRFDGVYMDCTVYLNGCKICDWHNGYTCFMADLTDCLREGENRLLVCARYETPNSRWYSGAGIYRSVTLLKLPRNHFVPDGIYIVTTKEERGFKVTVETEAVIEENVRVSHSIREKETGRICVRSEGTVVKGNRLKGSGAPSVQLIRQDLWVENPKLWELEQPQLYELVSEIHLEIQDDREYRGYVENQENLKNRQVNCFGFRTISFQSDGGFYLNGKHRKLNGVCEHHDLGCLGAAFHKTAMRRKFEILKRMGANAVRISHNMPAKEVIQLADEMGILIVSELYDMWEKPKNRYDFARFFHESWRQDTAAWVRRDRNSPSVIMWSIGNEIYDTHAGERGARLTSLLMDEVRTFDPAQNALVTLASNYMPWEHAQKCADMVKIAGYNYSETYYDSHHREHPDWVIYGSETASVVQSRGVYHFPADRQILTDDDLQCSSLGNSITSWGAKAVDAAIIAERDCPFSCGQFIWTGFDYIGEPTPYHTKNSYFGQIDTAGFEKDSYYLYQSAWTDYRRSPMVHVFPHWDFNEGQIIDVGICSNGPEVELFLNDESLGRRKIDHESGTSLITWWKVPYKKGRIRAAAYDETGCLIAEKERHSFGDARRLVLKADKTILDADGKDLLFVTIETVDESGYPVENANNRAEVRVTGAGRLVGLDNGDSTDYEQYTGTSRRLFSGKLLAVVQALTEEGEISIEVTSKGLEPAALTCRAVGGFSGEGISPINRNTAKPVKTEASAGLDLPVRKLEIRTGDGNILNETKRTLELEAVIHPKDAVYKTVEWRVTDQAGITSHIAKIAGTENKVRLTALGDGTCVVRCMTKNGTSHVTLISQLEVTITGLGNLCLDPYSFLSAGLYSFSNGRAGNGNERGVATARDGETQVGFENLDFGDYGSDTLTVPIFALTGDPYPIEIWEGRPGTEGSRLLAEAVYQKPSIWNVYQEETFHLNRRLTGVTTLCFVLRSKIHIKGFTFLRLNRAYRKLYAGEADRICGDSFSKEDRYVREIGNNVSLEFRNLEFGSLGVSRIRIYGGSPIACNSIHLCVSGGQENSRQLLEFDSTSGMEEKVFDLPGITGTQTLTFLFLPGSKFDFGWFQMEP